MTVGTGGNFEYAGRYMFLRYLAQQSAEHYSPSSTVSKAAIKSNVNDDRVTVKGSVLTVSDDYIGEKLDLTDYSFKIKNVNAKSVSKNLMTVGNKNMMITGNIIFGRLSDEDIITNYTAGNDKKITVIDGNGTTKKYSDAIKVLSVTDKAKSPVTVGSSIHVIDASARTTKVKITGNKLANVIIGGSKNDTIYGEGGNNTLSGGTGNDKLFGGADNDSLVGGKEADTLSGDIGNDKLFGD